MSIEQRLGYVPQTTRTLTEVAPPRLRAFVRDELVNEYGALAAYRLLCERSNQSPDPNVWGAEWAAERLPALFEDLQWFEVYKLIQELAAERGTRRRPWPDTVPDFEARANALLAVCGVAYELVGGEVVPFNPPVDGLNIEDAAPAGEARFRPAFDQYARARQALDQVPVDLFAAVREAANAVEAVAKILSGKSDKALPSALDALFGRGIPEYQRRLIQSIKEIYNYASQVPGARHGQHETVTLSRPEAQYAVRVCGAAMEFLIQEVGSR